MYDVSLMVQKKGAKSSIEIYYENEDKLAKYVMEVIENVNFDFYPELLNILIEFYKIYIKSDEREIILWPLTVDNLDNKAELLRKIPAILSELDLYSTKEICLKCENLLGNLLNTVFNSKKFKKDYDEIVELMKKATQ